jgi:serine/threonine protein phosphatase PrpC
MGTTLSVMVLLKNKNLIAHVGDSRIYRLCNNVLEQLTEDHTFAQLFMQMGHLTAEEADKHPIRHIMTQALGKGIEDIFLKIEKIRRGDIYLLCTDGLNDMLPDVKIKNILSKRNPPNKKCDRLVARALEMGGKDNVTVIVIEV